jgi:hypothetical protein
MASEDEWDEIETGGATELIMPELLFEDIERIGRYTPSRRLRGLYREVTATLKEVEDMLAPIVPVARQAELLVNVEGDELPNFLVFYEIATQEMTKSLKRVCDLLRECQSDRHLP